MARSLWRRRPTLPRRPRELRWTLRGVPHVRASNDNAPACAQPTCGRPARAAYRWPGVEGERFGCPEHTLGARECCERYGLAFMVRSL